MIAPAVPRPSRPLVPQDRPAAGNYVPTALASSHGAPTVEEDGCANRSRESRLVGRSTHTYAWSRGGTWDGDIRGEQGANLGQTERAEAGTVARAAY